ncbi:MAG TPA: hypothetical protein VI316_02945 [Candidatus Dormibacteraeota bacterium]
MSVSGPAAFALFVLVAIGLPALDIAVLRWAGRPGSRREKGRPLGPERLGVGVGRLAGLMLLLLADLLAVSVVAFAVAGSGYDRALALLVLAGIAALTVLVTLHRRRRAAPLAG